MAVAVGVPVASCLSALDPRGKGRAGGCQGPFLLLTTPTGTQARFLQRSRGPHRRTLASPPRCAHTGTPWAASPKPADSVRPALQV